MYETNIGHNYLYSLYCVVSISQEIAERAIYSSNCNGYVYVLGTTNINNFELTSQLASLNIIDIENELIKNRESKVYEIEIPLKEFKTSNSLLYRDFLELLKAHIYPNICIGIEYCFLETFLMNPENTVSPFEITLAGITNVYTIHCEVVNCSNEYINIQGSKELKLTEFNLKPPEKFQGIIKVKDNILIKFRFAFKIHDRNKLTSLEGKY